jgi:hypothetical protein
MLKTRRALRIFLAVIAPAILFLLWRLVRRVLSAPFVPVDNQHESRNG